ncbi:MAG: hypothetical protein QM758_12065 [Armatimonas sp.]
MRTPKGILTLGALALLCTVGLARQAGQGTGSLHAVVAGERAYILGPAEQVVGPGVRWVSPAPGGRYLLCERRKIAGLPVPGGPPPAAEVTLVSWDTKTRKSSTLYRYTEANNISFSTNMHGWFGGSSVALVYMDEGGRQSPVLVNLGAGTLQQMPGISPEKIGGVANTIVHPNLPLFGLVTTDITPERTLSLKLTVVRSSGAVVFSVPLTPGRNPNAWSQDGKRLYLTGVERVPNQKPRLAWYAMDLTGNETRLEKEPADKAADEPKELPIKATERPATLTVEATSEKLPSLWLGNGQKPEARITAEVDHNSGALLPDLSAVTYQYQSALYVVPLTALDKTAYDELLKRAKRSQLLSNIKQIGLAILMYSQDYDETLPPGGGIEDIIQPYLRDRGIMDGFQFTYSGSSDINKIEKPADTILGFISGPGGRAVIYADGHARWEDG